MSTRFLRARFFPDGQLTGLHDSDVPLHLFEEIAAVGRMGDTWVVDLLDYRGQLLEADVPLSSIHVRLDGEQLRAMLMRA